MYLQKLFQKKIILACCILCIAFLFAYIDVYVATKNQKEFKKRVVLTLPLDEKTLVAKSVFVLDTSNGDVLYKKNSDLVLPIASITKVMTAITALDLFGRKEKITTYLYQEEGKELTDKTAPLNGETWSLSQLATYMLIVSSNESAEAIKEYAHKKGINFIEKMNQNAKFFGLWNTQFSNTSGLDIDAQKSGATSTTEDVAFLFKHAIQMYPEIFETTRYTGYNVRTENGGVYFAQNTNAVIKELPGLYASKTGYTGLAGGTLVFATKTPSGKLVIVAILGSTFEGRFEDAKKINNEIQKIK